jgi:hypothetical protein
MQRLEVLARERKATASEFYDALREVVLSRDPSVAREGLAATRPLLFDANLGGDQRQATPDAWLALLMAWEEFSGGPLWGSEFDRLAFCAGMNACTEEERTRPPSCPPGADARRCQAVNEQYMDLKAQYLEVLKSGKLRGLADVKPKGWPG